MKKQHENDQEDLPVNVAELAARLEEGLRRDAELLVQCLLLFGLPLLFFQNIFGFTILGCIVVLVTLHDVKDLNFCFINVYNLSIICHQFVARPWPKIDEMQKGMMRISLIVNFIEYGLLND